MSDASTSMSDASTAGPMLAADGTPLKRSLRKALRREKMRALMLIAPLLFFILLTFIAPIADMLFRSVENQIVSNTLPRTVIALDDWDGQEEPGEKVYQALYFDLFVAAEAKEHTKLGTRLNYEETGISSLFRTTGRRSDDIGEAYQDVFEDVDPRFKEAGFWYDMMTAGGGEPDTALMSERLGTMNRLIADLASGDIGFAPAAEISALLPKTAEAYTDFAIFTALADGDVVAEEDPWEAVYAALGVDLANAETRDAVQVYEGPGADALRAAAAAADQLPAGGFKSAFLDVDEDWASQGVWETIKTYSASYTPGYFLNSVDLELSADGISPRDEDQQIYILLFKRTIFMSLTIMFSCILLGYPIAWLLANLPVRTSNLLLILVLLPFWTSLLVRTSAWKVLLQQQGVINDILVWSGIVDDANRLVMINNQFGTIVAMTHILLPFMILPLYSVMQTIPPSYLRAAKSLGATNWTAFWRVYFPQSVPGIGAGSILVFILSIGYYITPELVGGTTGTFISNRIAYHISSSLNWGLAAALGSILLAAVLILYWAYDKIVGIDNVKLG
ncbi:ABC transporter permease [Maritimibacter sp. 55A14]|uniref:ABC transporter permease n=1 Tax=Maritimibacter sp. 55A14 TaxID=2174844 RepID=UPI0018EE889A|nr:ABC transporter permease [Maritimibacter sp. 55A14]